MNRWRDLLALAPVRPLCIFNARLKVAILCTAIACHCLFAAGGEASSQSQQRFAQWTNATPAVFVKDRRLLACFTNDGFSFEAKWKKPRISPQEFAYASATVEVDESPDAPPASSTEWKPVRFIDYVEASRLFRVAAARLVPQNAGHGLYAQFSGGDYVLYRDQSGKITTARFEEKPADIIIDRRYGRQQIASALAQAIEADLRAAYPNETRFITVISFGRPRLFYLDCERKLGVLLIVPRPGRDANRPALGKNLKTLLSFAVVDNGWSFIKNPISSCARTVNQGLQWAATALQPHLRQHSGVIPPLSNAPAMDLAAWEKWLDRDSGMPRERGAVRLFINGEKFFPQFEHRIAEAQSNLSIHVCIFDRDDIAVRVADALKARSTNVEVNVVFDRLNSRGAGETPPATPMPEGFVPPSSIRSYLREGSGVHVRPQLNPGFTCDHSKVFIIDQRYAFMGGMNFGREYRYEWHDLMAEIEGPVVSSIQREFNKKWAQTGLWGDCGLAARSLCGKRPPAAPEPTDSIEVRRLYTKTFDRQIRRAELEAVNRAQSHILLENAYLYSNDMIVALVRARLRGVDVRVIMPGENDFESGHSSNLVTANFLRQHGIRVYFYPGMSHVKALIADGWLCFGSANFDALSLRLNRECNLASSDAAFVERFRREVFEADMAAARELTSDVAVDFTDHISDMLLNPF